MLEAIGSHGRLEVARRRQELDASLLECAAMVLLRQRQRHGDVAHGDAAAQPVLADQPQPLHPVRVRRGEQPPRHGVGVGVGVVGQRVGVDEVEQRPERVGVHGGEPQRRRRRRRGGELGLEYG